MSKLKVKDFRCVMAMDCSDKGIMTYQGFIDCPGHDLDGKEIFKTTVTPKVKGQYQKPEHSFSVADGSAEAPLFTTLASLMDHYKLPNHETGTSEGRNTTG